jgi:hypothetical protein
MTSPLTNLLKRMRENTKSFEEDGNLYFPMRLSEAIKLLRIIEVQRDALKEYESYGKMNDYPDHEVRHELCCAVPQQAINANQLADQIAGEE